jgi:hypothetical protein
VPNKNTIDDMSDEPEDHATGDLAVEQDDDLDGARKPNRQARIAAWAVIGLFVAIIPLALIGALRDAKGDPGNLTEVTYALPQNLPPLEITDATVEWGLDEWVNTSQSHLSGGAALGDLDGDGMLDLVLTGGSVGIFFGDGTRFVRASGSTSGFGGEALSTAIADLDGDGFGDILIGPKKGDVLVVWGGPWTEDRDVSAAATSTLPGGNQSTGFATADLYSDGLLDIVRIAYGDSSEDLLIEHVRPREFEVQALPSSNGKSLAAEIADIDGDGALDIWITRDVGWDAGADSVYSRDGDGVWQDVAPRLGLDFEIDGMGIIVADLTADGVIDGYLSDIGENEFVVGTGTGYSPRFDSGAARIRPPGSTDDVVSSSWASGAVDVNLDGILDLIVVNGGFPFFEVPNKIDGTTILMSDPPAIFLGIGDGRYADAWPTSGLDWSGPGRGLAVGDIDNDGDIDFIITRLEAGPVLYRNDSTERSLTVRAAPGCSPQGAMVSIVTSTGSITQLLGAHSFLGSHAPAVIAGEPQPGNDVLVRWPAGKTAAVSVPDAERGSVLIPCAR